ncbi:ABC transporter ATP-binding protein [Arthrobacter sp. SX1312]|uniref:ABC transporter ATP-binding protein n=1 Tax=Arthrobacter sp. SX1312 TaxID=2058896 RepID=UPI000CE38DD2|nr:ABC transporter ATP-binding protein [Arthrobacter sp. SX1312]
MDDVGGLRADQVRRRLGDTLALDGVSLAVEPGQVHALVGLNGAGKTTLLRVLLGMLSVDSGSVTLGGVALSGVEPAAWAGVGHTLETAFAYPELDVRQNLEIAARLRLVGSDRIDGMVEWSLSAFELGAYAGVAARRLSQGNRQRVGLAAALQHAPGTVVLDEPSNALDPAGVLLLRETLLRRRDDGAAILVSSHHLDEVARIADRITLMNRGRVIGSLDPDTLDLERSFFSAVHADDEARR